MKYLITIILFLVSIASFPQNRPGSNTEISQFFDDGGEIHFRFQIEDRELLNKLSSMIDIDNVTGNDVFAYANESGFGQFLKLNIAYQIIIDPEVDELIFNMLQHVDTDEITAWDFYPTYEAYLDMMNQFQKDYPNLCEVFSIGQSVNGRELMVAKISDNIATREAEPQFLYTGTMHGDELAGYVLFLRLIDYMLTNYGTDPKVTNLVNSLEIWINPLANPDGTFAAGNHTVSGATRNNANNMNLNRNYPDPEDGPHPDGKAWQQETLMFMQLAEENDFVMSANTHGGAEVINYPWDTWSRLSADDDWWVFVCREYVDTVHLYSPSSYMDGYDNGITNGYAWYTISGGRQDYMNYFNNCREVTMELSNVKSLPASQLEAHWDWNYRSLLNYLEQATFGVSGMVTDLITGEPLAAKVYIDGHDEDNSFVYTENNFGFYQRLLNEGTYDITFSAPGHYPQTISDVSVSKYNTTLLNVQLNPGDLEARFNATYFEIGIDGFADFIDDSYGNPTTWHWQFEGGTPGEAFVQNPTEIQYTEHGIFDVTLTVFNALGDSSVVTKEDYIVVTNEYLMQNGLIETCSGLFYDSGGWEEYYGDGENSTLTFIPAISDGKISVDFEEFNLEYYYNCSSDWLKIYDGPTTNYALIGTYCSTNSPGNIIAENDGGSLTFQFHSNSTKTRLGWKAKISCQMNQTISLNAGWNGISSYVQPDDPDLVTVFEAIMDELIILQADDGVFWPEQNVNTLVGWETAKGYIIKLDDAVQLNMIGAMDLNKEVELTAGWNCLPVMSACSVSVVDLIDTSDVHVEFIMEVAGTNMYWPAMGINTLEQLEPGKSYFLKSSETGTLAFPECK